MTSAGRPPITAVVPTYNRGPLIARALESILGQTRPPDEVVVVDDGSTDDTPERIQAYAGRVRYVRQPNAGGSAARNRGVEEATHPWVAFLDSDDHWRPEHIERMSDAIAATGGAAGFYFADTLGSSAEGGRPFWELAGLTIDGPHELRADATDWVMRPIQPTMLQSTVFRREDYRAAGGLDASLALRHDTMIFFQLGLGRPACAVAGAGCVMTADDDTGTRLSATHSDETPRYWNETEAMYARLLAGCPATGADRRELARRLAVARMRLARYAVAEGRRRDAVALVGRAMAASPRVVAGRLRARA
jgi:glycosyltransferase involved in cell wall biosynthesis